MSRAPLKFSFDNADLVKAMSEGDEDAASIITEILADPFLEGHRAIFTLDDMNIRGRQIVLAHDYCGSTPGLLGCIMTRDDGMVRHLNDTFHEEKAVTKGASLSRHNPA